MAHRGEPCSGFLSLFARCLGDHSRSPRVLDPSLGNCSGSRGRAHARPPGDARRGWYGISEGFRQAPGAVG
eukprot:scaffold6174_cov125-Isochrysis_galbana.AAC.5